MDTLDSFILSIKHITSCSCCKMSKYQQKYKFVKYDDEVVVCNNIMFDMKDINFTPDVEWTDCPLYEE